PRKPGGRKRPPRARGGEPPEAADEEEETGGPSLTGTIGLLAYMQEGGPGFWDDAVPLYHIPLLGILRAIYRSLYYYGLRFVRPLRIAGRLILPQLAKPLLTLWHLLRALLIALHYLTVGRLIRAFRAVQATHAKRIAVRKGRRVGLRTMLRGVLVDYRPVLRPAANVLMPVAGLLALMFMVQWLFGSTYALRVTFNGKQLGYISNESVFLQARAAANDNIAPRPESVEDAPAGETEEKPAPYAHFSIEKVNPEEIKSMDILTNELLNNTAGDMTSAYGLRIDGRLFATIKNSTDADIVLDSIKKQKAAEQHADSSAYVAFVQDVELVPGHYPASQLVDAQTLLAMLSKPQMEETVVKVQAGDTPLSLQYRYNLASVEELYALNPWMREPGAGLHVGDDVKVRAEVTRLEVKIIKNEVRYEEVPYETRDTDNYEEYKNVVRIRIKGVPGRDKITERVTYINGVRTGSPEVISRAREAEPVTERRDIGRKDPVVSLPSGEKVKLNVSTSGYQWPVQGCTRVSSPYGYRGRSFHKGIDIADGNTNGKIVVASKGGVVELVQLGGTSYGNMILINHGNGVKTRYAHLMSGSISVRQGQTVSIGQPIARVGSTGNSTGPHLHFEVIVNGSTQNPRNFVSP
ncbi:MAG: peptidoglycan DD-metalloendopeptidase family protein, partial [Firmicutes bacterium]|nr:peptidoglycan DD-metalloendopeptidase family protein [Bacillota bacterium]